MLKQVLIKSLTTGLKVVQKHSPVILAAVGVVGFIGATVAAVKTTPKVNLVLQEKEEDKGERLTKKEEIFTKAKIYLPSILLIVASTMCIGGSTYISHRRNLAVGAALVATEQAYKEYKSAVLSEVGEEKAKDISTKVAENKIEKHDIGNYHVIETGEGDTIFYDSYADRYFKSRRGLIETAENVINAQLVDSEWVYLDDVYDILKLRHTRAGGRLGWAYEFSGLVHISIIPVSSPWGEPIYSLEFNEEPFYDNRWC